MAKKYEVAVDGDTEEVTTKKEVRELVDDAVFDGDKHTIEVEVVDESANTEEESPKKATKSAAKKETENQDAPARGIPHYL